MLVARDGSLLYISTSGNTGVALDGSKIINTNVPAALGMRPIPVMAAPANFKARKGQGTPALDAALGGAARLAPRTGAAQDFFTLERVWFLIQFLRCLVTARPILMYVGEPGQGKTLRARIMGRLIMGPSYQVGAIPKEERDLQVACLNMPIMVMDNIENAPGWFADSLARMSTGGTFQARRLYSDSEMITLEPDVFVILTAIYPAVTRGDLLRRYMILRLGTIPHGQRRSEIELLDNADRLRGQVWGEALDISNIAWGLYLKGGFPAPTDSMADFEIVGRLVAEAAWGPNGVAEFERALASMGMERQDVAQDADPMMAALFAWASDPGNAQRWVKPADLLDGLGVVMGSRPGSNSMQSDLSKFGRFMSELMRKSAGPMRITRQRRSAGVAYMIEIL